MPALFFGPDNKPLAGPRDVIPHLGKGEAHWHRERSAYQTAHSWFNANGLPPAIAAILETDAALAGSVLREATFEKKTRLDPYGRESQTDVLAVVARGSGLAVVGVEAKVDETFGPLVGEWNDNSTGKLRRLVKLLDRLEFKSAAIASLRYQLFHRTAAVLIEAEAIGAGHAALIVQSFDRNRAGYADFIDFANALGTPVTAPGVLSRPKTFGGIALRLGWTENRKQYAEGD